MHVASSKRASELQSYACMQGVWTDGPTKNLPQPSPESAEAKFAYFPDACRTRTDTLEALEARTARLETATTNTHPGPGLK